MKEYINIYFIACIIWYSLFFIVVLYLYFVQNKPHKAKFQAKTLKEIPSNLTPSELSVLMYRKITPEVFTAYILILIQKGILSISKNNGDLVLTRKKDSEHLSNIEKLVLNVVINDMGNGTKTTFTQIKEYSKSKHNCQDLDLNYHLFLKMTTTEANKKLYYEFKSGYTLVSILRVLGIALGILNIVLGYFTIYGFVIFILAFFIVWYFYNTYKRNEDANEEYQKWCAFKTYLKKVDNVDEAKINDYIIYGLLLNNDTLEDKLAQLHFVCELNSLIKHNLFIIRLKTDWSI